MLYFRVLKNPEPTPLLPEALQGIAKFAHLVNVDFFKDLMQVLKQLTSRESSPNEESVGSVGGDTSAYRRDIRYQLLCIVTAFELLTGQGESSLLPIRTSTLRGTLNFDDIYRGGPGHGPQ